MTRRSFLVSGAAALAAACGHMSSDHALSSSSSGQPFEITHTDDEWRKLLTPAQYAVLREEDTEPPFSSSLLHESRVGTFACAGCALDLFSSTTKFDSGTGWPSVYAPLGNAVGTTEDTSLGMIRMAVHAAAAAVISDTSSTTARSRRACATASTGSRLRSGQRDAASF